MEISTKFPELPELPEITRKFWKQTEIPVKTPGNSGQNTNSGNFGIAEQFRYIWYLSEQSDSRNTEPDMEISGISEISGRPFLRKLQVLAELP